MQGSPKIVERLGDLLAAELAAVNTYFLHAKLLENWGYPPLAKHSYDESMGEMRHAEQLVDRIIYLDAQPNLQRMSRVRTGATVTEQLEQQLEVEMSTREALIEAIGLCNAEHDDGTRLLLEPMLSEGEGSIDWLETQLGLIASLGEPAYLAQQISADE
ncbi:MAG: bacterioferritin [Acidimicrobiia bacterium]|nr:bacterioferritin [Acidimicrobiia bacterium]